MIVVRFLWCRKALFTRGVIVMFACSTLRFRSIFSPLNLFIFRSRPLVLLLQRIFGEGWIVEVNLKISFCFLKRILVLVLLGWCCRFLQGIISSCQSLLPRLIIGRSSLLICFLCPLSSLFANICCRSDYHISDRFPNIV